MHIRKLVRKSYTPIVPIANTCSIGYPHDGRADNAAYRHDRRADKRCYRHDRRADSLSRALQCHLWGCPESSFGYCEIRPLPTVSLLGKLFSDKVRVVAYHARDPGSIPARDMVSFS